MFKTKETKPSFEDRVKSTGVDYDFYKNDPRGYLTLTTTQEGRIVCVSIQDDEYRIIELLWEAKE